MPRPSSKFDIIAMSDDWLNGQWQSLEDYYRHYDVTHAQALQIINLGRQLRKDWIDGENDE
jgi:hypothetical protein